MSNARLSADTLPHRLDRTVVIEAEPDTVFQYFTLSERWAAWWGAGSTIDPRPGGRVYVRHPNGIEAAGEVVDLAAPHRIVFTYGFVSGSPIPAGSSLVTIQLEAVNGATRLHLTHAFADAAARDEHVQGWRYQLSVFGNLVADSVYGDSAPASVDGWFAAWSDPDATTREATLERIVAPTVRFRDRFSLIDGLPDLKPHLAAVHRFMPGLRLQRDGEVRHCQGTVLADWVVRTTDGEERGRGTNVFVLGRGARIQSVTGVWSPPKSVA
jgi:uncharacterized protein YndB with AHSA1/START domain